MIKTMNKKHLTLAAAVAAVVVVGGISMMLSSSGKKAAVQYYDQFKERYYLDNVLSEGEVSYSMFSGNLTVKDPEIRLVAAQTNGARSFFKSLSGLMESARGSGNESGLTAWANYLLRSTTNGNATGLYLKADALKISHSGDSKDGKLHVQLLGLDMSNPYLSQKGQDIVLVSDVADEIQPRAEIDQYGSVVKSDYSWGSNMVNGAPTNAAFLFNATGDIGTKVDIDFTLSRSDDGEGKMKFVVVHRNDGSENGRILREAEFAFLPELDDVQDQLKAALSGFMLGAYETGMGQAVIAEAAGNIARKTKLASYSLTYKGFGTLKDSFKEYQAATRESGIEAFCKDAGFSTYETDFGAKAKGHSDSECAVAQKLVSEGEFEESYTFKEDKSLFANLFVSKGYEIEVD